APTTTPAGQPVIRNADAFNKPRRSMSGLSPAGTQVAQGCARALQKRSDNNGRAARLSPQTLLFATQSLARLYSIADHSQENACHRGVGFGARDCKKRQLLQKGPVKIIEIIKIPQNVLNRPVAARCSHSARFRTIQI